MPDIFQGDELELLTLVDPDNRGPVDWERRRSALAALRAGAQPSSETAKLHVIAAALELRARRPEAFAGSYLSVAAGPGVCAFMRGEHDVLVVVPLRPDGIRSLVLPDCAAGEWRDALAGGVCELERVVQLEQVIAPLGVGLLERA